MVIDDARSADHLAVVEVIAVAVVIVATIAALRTIAVALAGLPGRARVPNAGTMA